VKHLPALASFSILYMNDNDDRDQGSYWRNQARGHAPPQACSWAALSQLHNLRALVVRVRSVDHSFWDALPTLIALTRLEFNSSGMCPTAAQLSAVSDLSSLKELSFVGQLRSSFPRHAISCLTQITSLRCDGCDADYQDPASNEAQFVSAVAQLTQLRTLLLSRTAWHNELQQLTALTRLRLKSIDGMQLPASVRELELFDSV
jgi:hypothetical protein